MRIADTGRSRTMGRTDAAAIRHCAADRLRPRLARRRRRAAAGGALTFTTCFDQRDAGASAAGALSLGRRSFTPGAAGAFFFKRAGHFEAASPPMAGKPYFAGQAVDFSFFGAIGRTKGQHQSPRHILGSSPLTVTVEVSDYADRRLVEHQARWPRCFQARTFRFCFQAIDYGRSKCAPGAGRRTGRYCRPFRHRQWLIGTSRPAVTVLLRPPSGRRRAGQRTPAK